MTAANRIKEYIATIPEGESFPSRVLRSFATTENIRQVLNRLVKAGKLKRVARGIFVKPKYVENVGQTLPFVSEIVETIAKSTGETIVVHGAEAARQLQLTTQVPMQPVFYTSGNTRTVKIANQVVRLKHVNPHYLIAPGTIPGLVILALYYLERENVTLKTIEKIKKIIPAEEFQKITQFIQYMPAWMSNIFYHYQQGQMNEH